MITLGFVYISFQAMMFLTIRMYSSTHTHYVNMSLIPLEFRNGAEIPLPFDGQESAYRATLPYLSTVLRSGQCSKSQATVSDHCQIPSLLTRRLHKSMETQSASSPSVPSPYGRACTTCSKAKAKCVLSREGDVKCERYVTTDPLGTCHMLHFILRD